MDKALLAETILNINRSPVLNSLLDILCSHRIVYYIVSVNLLQVDNSFLKLPMYIGNTIVVEKPSGILLFFVSSIGSNLCYDVVLEVSHREGLRAVDNRSADNLIYKVCILKLTVDLQRLNEVYVELANLIDIVGVNRSPYLQRSIIRQNTDTCIIVQNLNIYTRFNRVVIARHLNSVFFVY